MNKYKDLKTYRKDFLKAYDIAGGTSRLAMILKTDQKAFMEMTSLLTRLFPREVSLKHDILVNYISTVPLKGISTDTDTVKIIDSSIVVEQDTEQDTDTDT